MAQESHAKVAILNADAAYCALLKSVLDHVRRFERATVHSNISDAAAHWGQRSPDVVLVDIALSDSSPLDLIRALTAKWPASAVVVLTDRQDDASILAALRAGASGYLLKETPLSRVCEAIDEVRAGGCPMSPAVARRLAGWFHARGAAEPPVELSSREQEILALLAEDRQNKEIAETLSLAEATVRAHLRRIYEKLDVHSRAQAVARMKRRPRR